MILLCPIGLSFANDVPLPMGDFLQHPEVLGYSRAEIFVWNFCATVIIEYFVICAFLGWPENAMIKLVFWVLLLNVITNPASQIAAIFFGRVMGSEISAWVMTSLAEFVAATLEFGIMRWLFRRMHDSGAIDRLVTTKRTIRMVLTANAANFIFGFVVLIGLLIDMGP